MSVYTVFNLLVLEMEDLPRNNFICDLSTKIRKDPTFYQKLSINIVKIEKMVKYVT